jgi:hypothetical protein
MAQQLYHGLNAPAAFLMLGFVKHQGKPAQMILYASGALSRSDFHL